MGVFATLIHVPSHCGHSNILDTPDAHTCFASLLLLLLQAEQESLAAQMVHNARPTDLPGQSPLAKRGSFTTAVKAMAGFSMVSGGKGGSNAQRSPYQAMLVDACATC